MMMCISCSTGQETRFIKFLKYFDLVFASTCTRTMTTKLKMSVCVAGYLFHHACSTSTQQPPAAGKRADRLLANVEQRLGKDLAHSKISLPHMNQLHRYNDVLNVVRNLRADSQLDTLLTDLFQAEGLLTNFLDVSQTDKLSTHAIFEYSRGTECIFPSCKGTKEGTLSNCWKSFKNTSGSTCVVIDDLKGPSVARSHRKECGKCGAIYTYNTIVKKDGSIVLLPVSGEPYFQSNTTIYHTNTFAAAGNCLLEEGINFEYFSKTWNRRHAERRQQIAASLGGQTLGNHKSCDAQLKAGDLNSAFFNYFLTKTVYQYMVPDGQLLCLGSNEIEAFKMSKLLQTVLTKENPEPIPVDLLGVVAFQGKVRWSGKELVGIKLHQPIGHHSGDMYGARYFAAEERCGLFLPKEYVSLRSSNKKDGVCSRLKRLSRLTQRVTWSRDDQFKLLWQLQGANINKLPASIMSVVPVKYGLPHTGHRFLFGDGNAKSSILCKTPHTVFGAWNAKEVATISNLHSTQREFEQCPRRPYCGNKHQLSFTVCSSCVVRYITETPLKVGDINSFVNYAQSKLKLHSLEAKRKEKDHVDSVKFMEKLNILKVRLATMHPSKVALFKLTYDFLTRSTAVRWPSPYTCMFTPKIIKKYIFLFC